MERLLVGIDAFEFLRKEGFPLLRTRLAQSVDEAVQLAKEIGFPISLKVSSPDVIHKSDLGGVKVGLRDEEQVRGAFQEIADAFRAMSASGKFEGVLVQEMGKGTEVIIGAIHDPQFGPVIMFGLGGIFVEVVRDVSFRLIPIERKDAYEMIREIKGFPILSGARGEKVDLEAIEVILMQVSSLVIDSSQIVEMDLNPVFANDQGCAICDARIKMKG